MNVRIYVVVACLLAPFAMAAEQSIGQDHANSGRVQQGLVVLYDFAETDGNTVYDRAGTRSPIHLKIEDTQQVRRRTGSLEIRGSTFIQSASPARKLTAAIRKSRSVTVEAWIQPANTNQSGPARIVTLSKDSSNRNFTLGQDGDQFDVRFRSKRTNANGIPS